MLVFKSNILKDTKTRLTAAKHVTPWLLCSLLQPACPPWSRSDVTVTPTFIMCFASCFLGVFCLMFDRFVAHDFKRLISYQGPVNLLMENCTFPAKAWPPVLNEDL